METCTGAAAWPVTTTSPTVLPGAGAGFGVVSWASARDGRAVARAIAVNRIRTASPPQSPARRVAVDARVQMYFRREYTCIFGKARDPVRSGLRRRGCRRSQFAQ